MIRIKCPKCAAPLALDDDQAGGVGECTECGAKFRVPKAKAPVRTRKADADDDDEDEDDDDEDDEEEERSSSRARPRRRPRGRDEDDEDDDEGDTVMGPSRRSRATSGTLKGNLIMVGIMLVIVMVVGLASIFLNKLGTTGFIGSVIGALLCSIMVVRAATKDGGTLAFICVVLMMFIVLSAGGALYQVCFNTEHGLKFPFTLIFFFAPLFWSAFLGIYVISHWHDAQRFGMVWVFCVVMAGVTFTGALLNKGRIESYRSQVKARLGVTMHQPRGPLIQVDQRG
jgi:DNA-directed RNA polymerase subunit M/transcription elongation factor TFIIS